MLRVIGAGFGRTGTASLKAALDMLGFGPTYHMFEVFAHPEHIVLWKQVAEGAKPQWDRIFEGYQSAVDWPASAFYRDLMEEYPAARVILTVRDPERWHESGRNTIFPPEHQDENEEISEERRLHRDMARTIVWNGVFDGKVRDREHAIEVFNRHIATVKSEVPTDRLLVFDVREGWEPLCAFLDVPVPDVPFPRLNDTQTFNEQRGSAPEGVSQ